MRRGTNYWTKESSKRPTVRWYGYNAEETRDKIQSNTAALHHSLLEPKRETGY